MVTDGHGNFPSSPLRERRSPAQVAMHNLEYQRRNGMERYQLNLSVVFLLVHLSVYGQDMSQSSIQEQNTGNQGSKHRQYKLIDLGTLGGPSSIIFGETGPLNNAGEVTKNADTAALDPYFPNDNPYFGGDPYVQDAFLWRHGSMHDLGSLPGGTGKAAANGSATMGS